MKWSDNQDAILKGVCLTVETSLEKLSMAFRISWHMCYNITVFYYYMNRMTETNKSNNTTASKSVQSGFMENLSDAVKCQYNKNSVSCVHSLYLTEIVQRLQVHMFLDNDKW